MHGWLYTYIYKDSHEIFFPKSKMIGKILVIVVSAIVHDIMGFLSMRMFFPLVVFTMTIPSIVSWCFKENDHWILNVLSWYSMGCGVVFHVIMYCLEYNARQNCSLGLDEGGWMNFIVPRFVQCSCIS